MSEECYINRTIIEIELMTGDGLARQKEKNLDSVVDKLLQFAPFFYRNVFRPPSQKSKLSPVNLHLRALSMLVDCGMLPSSELGRRLGISKPNVTSLVDKLIDKGYAERLPDIKDRRVINVCVTVKGRRFVANRKRAIRGLMKKNMSVLKPQEMEELSNALNVCKDVISRMGERSL
jgi:DNA-binding MarR family transcriptional regulator